MSCRNRNLPNCLATVFSVALLTLCVIPSASSQEATGEPLPASFLDTELTPELVEQYELKLNSILKTRRDEEKQFIAQLVRNIEAGTLPIKLVSTSFKWVQNKRPDTNYPFIYFEKVLRLQAQKLNIEAAVPPFDFTVYRSAGQRTDGQQLDAGQQTEGQTQTLLESARSRVANLLRFNLR